MHVQPGGIQGFDGESVAGDMHSQRKRETQPSSDSVQRETDGPVPAVDGLFQSPIFAKAEIFRQQIENKTVVQRPPFPSAQNFQGRFRKCPKLSIWDKAFVQVWKEISPETYLLR